MKIIIFLIMSIINYFCLWLIFAFLGIDSVQPIGLADSFGYVLPPKWLLLLTVFISLVEYVALTTLFPLKKNGGSGYVASIKFFLTKTFGQILNVEHLCPPKTEGKPRVCA